MTLQTNGSRLFPKVTSKCSCHCFSTHVSTLQSSRNSSAFTKFPSEGMWFSVFFFSFFSNAGQGAYFTRVATHLSDCFCHFLPTTSFLLLTNLFVKELAGCGDAFAVTHIISNAPLRPCCCPLFEYFIARLRRSARCLFKGTRRSPSPLTSESSTDRKS